MKTQIENLIFEGGGVKGVAYIGAMEILEERGILDGVKRVGGTSAGAINALLVGLNYSHAEIVRILWVLDFNKFLDDSVGIVRDTKRLIEDFGWHKGDFFREWIGKIIYEKTGNSESTFADLEMLKHIGGLRSMYFVGANLSTKFSEIFSYEHTPLMCVADAVRISMSLPLVFAAKRSLRGDVYVDGGILNNYPIKMFDKPKYCSGSSNLATLGFRLDTRQEIDTFRDHAMPASQKIDDFLDFTTALITTIFEAQQNSHLNSEDWQRTIYIDTLNVQTTDFGLSDTKKLNLIESGREGATKYFAWRDAVRF